jgi:hypothetical protein
MAANVGWTCSVDRKDPYTEIVEWVVGRRTILGCLMSLGLGEW